MPLKSLPLPDLIGACLHVKAHHTQKRRSKSTAEWPVTWPFAVDETGDSSSRTPVKTLRKKLHSHFTRRKRESGNCGGSRDSRDGAQNMSESARIAFAYRASQKAEADSKADVSLFHPPPSRNIHPSPGGDDNQESGKSSVSVSAVTSKVQFGLSDILSRLSPVIVQKEEVLNRERCRLALRHHRLIPTNVIVESQCPDRTPHIVITPPPEQEVYEAPYVARNNQIPFQCHKLLFVPALCHLTLRMKTFEPWRPMFHHRFPAFPRYSTQNAPANRLVFNRPKFIQWVKSTEEHRNCLFRRLLIPAVRRHLVKASAVTASLIAASFRARYDSPEFLESLENPFRWTDPASAFLSLYRGHPVGVHHIPSPEPFSVPHILIEESFGNDQSVADGNAVPVQKFADRNSLFVPPGTNFTLSWDVLKIEQISLDYDTLTCESSLPRTPTDLGKVDYNFFPSWDIGTPLRDVDFFPQTQCHPTTRKSRSYRDSMALFFINEEEEDEFI